MRSRSRFTLMRVIADFSPSDSGYGVGISVVAYGEKKADLRLLAVHGSSQSASWKLVVILELGLISS